LQNKKGFRVEKTRLLGKEEGEFGTRAKSSGMQKKDVRFERKFSGTNVQEEYLDGAKAKKRKYKLISALIQKIGHWPYKYPANRVIWALSGGEETA